MSEPRPAIAPARSAAAHVLLAVERGTAHSDEQLRTPRVEALSRQDRDLTQELVMGTLRWQLVLDREIAARLSRPDLDMHFLVIIALRLGAYQLLFLDRIPAHAAVNDSVELAKQTDGPQAANLVNAVLRRLHRERGGLVGLRSSPAAAYPPWLLTRWRARFGAAAAERICAYGQQPPQACLRASSPAIIAEQAPDQIQELAPGAFLRDARHAPAGKPADLSNTRIQDEASQLVAEIAALDAGPAVLDCCAAPGGKTAILAERNPHAAITAMDVSATRLRIMQRRFPEPQAAAIAFLAGDATRLPPGSSWSTILCDVPCSGTGTLARNPEIRARLDEHSIGRQAERQRAILISALGALRPGGRLVYSTCSLEPEENEQVVEAALGLHPGITVQPIAAALERLRDIGIVTAAGYTLLTETALAGPFLRTIPGLHPCDGFFAALLTRPQPGL